MIGRAPVNWRILRSVTVVLVGLFGLTGPATRDTLAAGAIYVDIRESDAPGARVVERWKLYGSSYALVIGIDQYKGGWPRLSNAVKDARLVAAELESRGFQVETLTNVSADHLRSTMREFFTIRGADPEARLFLWFAGHGHTEAGEGYIVPVDAPTPQDPTFRLKALHMGDVGTMVRLARAKHVLAVFDSCFAGTIFSSQRSRPPAAVTQVVARPVRQFMTSGDADQQVSDDGTFRQLFIRALRGEEQADANRDGYLTATELGLYLEDRIVNLTQASQTPRSGKLRDPKFDRGDFVFLLPQANRETEPLDAPETAAVPSKPAEGPSEAALDLTFWQAIEGSDDPADFQAYLEAFPEGRFAPLARVRARGGQAAAGAAASGAPAPPQPQRDATAPAQTARKPPPEAEPEASGGPSVDEFERYLDGHEHELDAALKRFLHKSGHAGPRVRQVRVHSHEVQDAGEQGYRLALGYFMRDRQQDFYREEVFLVRLKDGALEFAKVLVRQPPNY